jgi:hypothetical protein
MRTIPKSRVLVVDMQLGNRTVIRKLNEDVYYWFVDIETETQTGREIKRVLENYRYKKTEFPTLDILLERIRVIFSIDPMRQSGTGVE